jgi:hypothetical protein
MVFIESLNQYPNWRQNIVNLPESAGIENINQLTEFIDSTITAHVLEDAAFDLAATLSKNLNTSLFKQEADRLSGQKGSLTRKINIHFSRGWLAEFIGYFSDECWVWAQDIISSNQDMFGLILEDQDTGELLGGSYIIPNSIKGEAVLIDRGFSPRTEVTSQLHIDSLMDEVTAIEEAAAQVLGSKKILVLLRKLQGGLGTNNPDIINYYERITENQETVGLDRSNNFNNHNIQYGVCVVLKEVKSKPSASSP